MSNPAHSMATWLANYIDPAYAALGGVIGTFVGMALIALAGVAVTAWIEGVS